MKPKSSPEDHRQADPTAFIFRMAVQAMKWLEHSLDMLRLEPDPVICDTNLHEPVCASFTGSILMVDVHNRRDAELVEFERVPNQILKQLPHVQWIYQQGGKLAGSHLTLGVLDPGFEIIHNSRYYFVQIHRDRRTVVNRDPRVIEEILDHQRHARGCIPCG